MKKFLFLLLLLTAKWVDAQPPLLKLILPVGHSGGIYKAIYSPDYKFILSIDRFETPRVWNAQTGHLLANLQGHNGRVYRIGYSNDGKFFFTAGSEDSTIFIWRTRDATKLYTFKTNHKTIQSATFNFDGSKFTVAGNDVKTWDLNTGKLLHTFAPYIKKEDEFFELRDVLITRSGNIGMISSTAKAGFFRHYWELKSNKILAISKYNDTTKQYQLVQQNITDTSLFNLESSQWVYPTQFKKEDRGLVYDIDSNDLWITDSSKQTKLFKIAAHTAWTRLFYYSPDSLLVAEPTEKLYAGVWNPKTMQMTNTLFFQGIPRPNVHTGDENSNIIFNNNRSLAVELVENNFHVYDAVAMAELTQFRQKAFAQKIKNAFFSNDNSRLVTIMYTEEDAATLWDIKTGKPIRVFAFDKEDIITHASFSEDNKWLALFGWGPIIKIYETNTGTLIKTLNKFVAGEQHDVFGGSISPDKTKIFFIDNYGLFRVFDIATGKQLYALDKQPGYYITAGIFRPDSKSMILGTSTSINKVIDLETKKELYQFFQVDSTDYFSQVPEGYYQATPGAAKLIHYVTKDLQVITFDQLDIKLNRPDKVLEAIGSKDALLIDSYRKAYQKRIKKLGVDTTQFSSTITVPDCDFANRYTITHTQPNKSLVLKVTAKDATYNVDRFNVWVNDVPLYGVKGISIARNKKTFDTSITIQLSQGENRIETSVINANGTESFKSPLFVQHASQSKQPVFHFIGIGINEFANPQYNLSWSVKDIRDMAAKLQSKYPGIIIDTLLDKKVTRDNILALKQKLQQLGEDDIVMVSYSGHGVLSKNFDYFLSTYHINFDEPEKNGLAYDELESLLDNIKPRQKLMLIDACHSGEIDKDELVKIEAASKELNKNGVSTKSNIKIAQKKNLGMANSFELMQNIFVNVSKGTGATIISAAGGMQYALERGDLKNGVFTYCIIDAMNKNKNLTVSQLKKTVSERVPQLTNGLQKPTSRNETNNYDWRIW